MKVYLSALSLNFSIILLKDEINLDTSDIQ